MRFCRCFYRVPTNYLHIITDLTHINISLLVNNIIIRFVYIITNYPASNSLLVSKVHNCNNVSIIINCVQTA